MGIQKGCVSRDVFKLNFSSKNLKTSKRDINASCVLLLF